MVIQARVAERFVRVSRIDPLAPSTSAALRKDFLLLMSNVKRVKDYEDALELKQAFILWANRFEDWGQQIRSDIKSRVREVPGKLAVPERDVQSMLENMNPFWAFASELRVPLRDYDPKLEQWWPKEAIFRLYEKEVGRWAQRARKKALDAWKWLDRVSEWAASWHGGSDPIRIKTKDIENVSVEGFKVQLVGFEPDEDRDEFIARLHEGLKFYRTRAQEVLPWLLANQLPLVIHADFNVYTSDSAASYHGTFIEVTPWGHARDPKKFTHEMAHEMSHHLLNHLSGEALEEWKLFIKGGQVQIDLKDLAQEITARSNEELYNIEKRLKVENPILALQLEGLINDPYYRELDLFSLHSIREYIESGKDTRFTVSSKPITGYARKNTDEAFCEAVGYLVAYGPRTVLPEVQAMLRLIVPSIRTAGLAEKVVDRFLTGSIAISERVVTRHKLAKYKSKKVVPKASGKGTTEVLVYSDRQIALRKSKKSKRLQKLSGHIDKMMAKVKKDLTSSDQKTARVALAIMLINETYERVGNDTSAAGENSDTDSTPHLGVTGWSKKNIKFTGGKAKISYRGKSSVDHVKIVEDPATVKALKKAYDECEGDKDCIFHWADGKVTAKEVNEELRSFGDLTAKDLRGWHANRLMKEELAKVRKGKLPEDKKERADKLKDEWKKALEITAKEIQHEPGTLQGQYLVDAMREEYLKDGTIIDRLDKTAMLDNCVIDSPASVFDQVGIKPGDHYTITCDGCGAVTRCRCNGPRIEAHVPSCPECDLSALSVRYQVSEEGVG